MSDPVVTFSKSMLGRSISFGAQAALWTGIDLCLIKFLLWLDWSMEWSVIYVVLFDINLVVARLDELRQFHDKETRP